MKKKLFVQAILIFLILYFSYFVYKKYFFTNNIDQKLLRQDLTEELSDTNIIYNINYSSSDADGQSYKITAQKGSIDASNGHIIHMIKVTGNIVLEDSSEVIITSDFAKYNTITYKTEFNSNVVSKYLEHKIFSEFLIIDFNKNILEATKKMTYKNSNTTMKADVLEVNLLTKDIKIYNLNEDLDPKKRQDKNLEIDFKKE